MSEIELQCLSLPRDERKRLIDVLTRSLKSNVTGKTLDEIFDAVFKVFKYDFIKSSRERKGFIGRVIFSWFCILEGYSEPIIGKYLNRHHSTVHIMKVKMKDWMAMPNVYKEENELYVKVKSELSYETD